MIRRLADLVRDAASRLEAAGIDGGAREALLLLAHVSGMSPARLGAEMSESAGPELIGEMDKVVARRCARAPMSHITGKRLFYKNEFQVTPDVLDPRPETEALVSAALQLPWARVLDLGTGSGAIILSLLAERAEATGIATDLSPAALGVAQANAKALGLAVRCELILSDWFTNITGRFDLIVSNPPYIAKSEMPDLAPELSFEPRMALTDGADGLSAYRAICGGAGEHLAPGGWLMVEIGWQQGQGVAALMRDAGLKNIRILPDLDGRDRVVQGHALA